MPTLACSPVCQDKHQAVEGGQEPAGHQGEDDSAGGDDGVVLESRRDVQEPVQCQQGRAHDGDEDYPQPDPHL